MKTFKTLTLLCILLMMYAMTMCKPKSGRRPTKKESIEYAAYNVVSADGCQYIRFHVADSYIHKGNCNNPIHSENRRP